MHQVVQRIEVNQSIVCAELDQEMVLLNVETGKYFGLDSTGTRIWELLADGADEEGIVAALLNEYEVDPIQLRRDVSGFLASLSEKNLVQLVGS